MKHTKSIWLTAGALLLSCNDAGFQSPSDEERQPLALTIQCENDGTYDSENQVIPVPTDRQSLKLELTGEFCPQAPAQLSLLFLIDFSLSMYNRNAEPKRGNDQLKDGSCGRLDAAMAIIERIEEKTENLKADVDVGLVAFSSDVDATISLRSLSNFKKNLIPENFCSGNGKTNYKAAFEEAESLLEEQEGTKIVYLITDGLPSLGGDAPAGLETEHQDAAKKASKSLRSNIDKLTFNTIYLGNEFEDVDIDPEEFLEDITGEASRVKIVSTADKLAQGILELENPPVDLDTSSVSAKFENGIENPIPIKFVSFEPSADRDQVWVFQTELFSPFATDQGEPQLIIQGKDGEGDLYKVVFDIEPDTSPPEDE